MKNIILALTIFTGSHLIAAEKAKILNPEDVYYLKICQTEQKFSAKPKDLFKCIEEKKKNKEYSDYMTYETFEDIKY